MGCDHCHSTLEGESEEPGIRQDGVDHGHGVFSASMSQKRQTHLSHAFPKRRITVIRKIDSLTIWQALHQHGTAVEASIKFIEFIFPGRMNRNPSQKFWVIFRETKDNFVRHKHR